MEFRRAFQRAQPTQINGVTTQQFREPTDRDITNLPYDSAGKLGGPRLGTATRGPHRHAAAVTR